MRKIIKCLVLIPVGPRSNPDYVNDTIESVAHYMDMREVRILLLDDSRSGLAKKCIPHRLGLVIMEAASISGLKPREMNVHGSLFVKQMFALQEINRQFDWGCLLRLDDDALIIGPKPYEDALDFFEANRDVGLLGAYLYRGDGTSKEAAMAEKGKAVIKQLLSRVALKNPMMPLVLTKLLVSSKRIGYRLGDMCTGGSFFLSGVAYKRIASTGSNHFRHLQSSFLTDDLLFAIHTAAAGFKFSDFDETMAINWRGLPMPLDDLVSRKKKIVHPVKDPDDPEHEKSVRAYFQRIRSQDESTSQITK